MTHALLDRELEEPTTEELATGMPVAFAVAGETAAVDVTAYVDEIDEYEDDDHPRADYPRRITLEEYHNGGDDLLVTTWVIDPLRHRVWCEAPCDDERERAGDLEAFTTDL